jgi:hypothetical protein
LSFVTGTVTGALRSFGSGFAAPTADGFASFSAGPLRSDAFDQDGHALADATHTVARP